MYRASPVPILLDCLRRIMSLLQDIHLPRVFDDNSLVGYGIECPFQHIGHPQKTAYCEIETDQDKKAAEKREEPGSAVDDHHRFPVKSKACEKETKWDDKSVLGGE